MSKQPYLECGRVRNTHGVRGVLCVESFCDSPAVFAGLPALYRNIGGRYVPCRMTHCARKGELLLISLEGVDDMDAAQALKGEILYAARQDIPLAEGAYFLADLPGLPVIDADNGKCYGTVTDVRQVGGQQLLAVATATGERLLPMVSAFLDRVDAERGVFVRPIPGLLEDAD